ncbi:alpha/beta fold hydrolase [Streptomyces sp. NPDC003691]
MPSVPPHEVHGHGPHPVIALHGWFGDRTSYTPLMRWADASAFTYALLDQRGYGAARSVPGRFTVEEIATDALVLADHLGWETFSVVGHSMGGKVAQRLAADVPGRLRGLVGISPVPASGAGLDETARELFTRAQDDPALRRAIIDRTTGERLPGRWLDAMVDHSLACSTREAMGAYLPDWAGEDFHQRVTGSPVPALFIAGRHDPELSAEVLRATVLSWFPDSRLTVLEDAGHYAMDETPLALVHLVESFLASVPARPVHAGPRRA